MSATIDFWKPTLKPVAFSGPFPDIPRDVATCPICDHTIYIEEIDEWFNDGRVSNLAVECETFPGFEDDDLFNQHMKSHYQMPYVDWLPVQKTVIAWFNDNFVVAES